MPRIYYGWLMVIVAAFAMVATFPGRTHGLGIITERLLADESLKLDRPVFAEINLAATLIGALFCFGVGAAIDRRGVRIVLTLVLLALGLTCWGMSRITDKTGLLVATTLTRGFGQSALSIVSLSIVGKWFQQRINLAMGTYSALMAIGFSAAFVAAGEYKQLDWRIVWSSIGVMLLASAPVAWLLTRNSPEQMGLHVDGDAAARDLPLPDDTTGWTLGDALRTPAFWFFAIATSFFGLSTSGMSLFNQSILAERGFDAAVYYKVAALGMFGGIVGNLVAGLIASRLKITHLMGLAMIAGAGTLYALTRLNTYPQLVANTIASSLAGGTITVLFFAVWVQLYGRAHLGRIQGMAQLGTVLASAVGPVFLAQVHAAQHSYAPALLILAGASAFIGVAGWFVPLPRREQPPTIGGRFVDVSEKVFDS